MDGEEDGELVSGNTSKDSVDRGHGYGSCIDGYGLVFDGSMTG
jgi:hypothetical protein